MKRLLSVLLILIFLSGCTAPPVEQKTTRVLPESVRGVWLFYRELSMADEKGGTAESFTEKISSIFDNCVSLGINTVFFHVRPFADSFCKSSQFPTSEYLTGEQGGEISYDPLEIAVSAAHEMGISLHAWINPFRISFSDDASRLADSNPAKKLIESGSDRVCRIGGGFYFNPSCAENHKLIIDGVREIVKNYNVDGVHIDDYFYPDTAKSIDKAQYEKYLSGGGKLSLSDWRIQWVNLFVSSLYSAVKAEDESLVVSVSPAGNIDNNYNKLYADVKRWGSVGGYCDWLIPQIYFGYKNSVQPFKKCAEKWRKITTNENVKLIVGLAAYKTLSGESDEWKEDDIIVRQRQTVQDCGYDGFALFSYSSIVSPDFNSKL